MSGRVLPIRLPGLPVLIPGMAVESRVRPLPAPEIGNAYSSVLVLVDREICTLANDVVSDVKRALARLARRPAPLTAYRVHLSDGSSYVTSMAAGVTLEQARAYFLGSTQFLDIEETKKVTVTDVTAAAGGES